MIILTVFVAVLVINAVVIRLARRGFRDRRTSAAKPPDRVQYREPPYDDDVIDTNLGPSTWTALDDYQLTRLLKDSS